jgi:O-antigen/teichoic acid export membrane protein
MPGSLEEASSKPKSFVHNVLWSWSGVIFSLLSGLLLSPYVIHHLGDARYGIWALVFSLVDYFALVDLGFRSAVVKYAAHYRATGEMDRLEALVSTGFLYFAGAAVVVCGAALLLARNVTRFFHVSPGSESAFRFLTITIGVGFALGIIFSICSAVLEAYQRFDITSRVMIVYNGARVIGCFTVIHLGFGLKAMGICVLGGQLLSYALTYLAMRRLLPGRSFSPRRADLFSLRQMMRYGIHTFIANISLIVLNQDAPVLVGHFLSDRLVAYYSFPLRLLSYSVDLADRLSLVTGSKTAELTVRGDTKTISRMAVIVNRYCLTLFLPLAIYLVIFGRQLLRVWLNPAFAANSTALLPILGAGMVIGIAAQYNSSAILYGLAKHSALARAVAVEAVISVAALWYVIPRYGILGAACVSSVLMIVSRGIYVPYVASRQVGLKFGTYLWGIYARPLEIAAPISTAVWLVNRAIGQPATWGVVMGGGAAMAACYYTAVFFFGLEPEHREMIAGWMAAGRRVVARAWAAGGARV